MKFELTYAAPSKLTRALIGLNQNGSKQYMRENFEKGVVYDTADYSEKYPSFAEDVLTIKSTEQQITETRLSELQTNYGDDLIVHRCKPCGGKKIDVIYPLFEEVK